MARPKLETEMVRKNLFVPDRLAAAVTHVAKRQGISEADIFRGAVASWMDRYRRATQRLQNQMIEDAQNQVK